MLRSSRFIILLRELISYRARSSAWQSTWLLASGEKALIPRENHIAQVQCYSTLLGQYGIPVGRLILVYVDDKDIVPLQVPLGNRREWIIKRATALYKALENRQNPVPEAGFACKYCPFVSICPQNNESLNFAEAMA